LHCSQQKKFQFTLKFYQEVLQAKSKNVLMLAISYAQVFFYALINYQLVFYFMLEYLARPHSRFILDFSLQ
jgi:hypothetical protein